MLKHQHSNSQQEVVNINLIDQKGIKSSFGHQVDVNTKVTQGIPENLPGSLDSGRLPVLAESLYSTRLTRSNGSFEPEDPVNLTKSKDSVSRTESKNLIKLVESKGSVPLSVSSRGL